MAAYSKELEQFAEKHLARFFAKDGDKKRRLNRLLEVTERVMAGQKPWPCHPADINESFIAHAIEISLGRRDIAVVKASRRNALQVTPAALGSPAELFDALTDLLCDSYGFGTTLDGRYGLPKSARCSCCGSVKNLTEAIRLMLRRTYPVVTDSGLAEDLRRDVVIRYWALQMLCEFHDADNIEPLVLAFERGAIRGELSQKPGVFLIQGR